MSEFRVRRSNVRPGKGALEDYMRRVSSGLQRRIGLQPTGKTLRYRQLFSTISLLCRSTISGHDTASGALLTTKFTSFKRSSKVIERCILMATDPGDLVLDPTCGSGTTAYVAEQWGRRWITIDTSRVALALGPRPHHGRALSVLPAGRFPRGPDQGSRSHPHRAEFAACAREHPPRLRL